MALSDWVSPEVRRAALLALVCAGHYTWRQLVNLVVPDPYLDEVFHAPQAQTYWEGNWSQWDPKITTPPALYVFSHAVNSFRALFSGEKFEHNTADLRLVNLILLYVLLVALYAWTAVSRREINEQNVLQREFSIVCFPLLFFFSGLYYTDVFSTLAVIVTYTFWLAGNAAEGPTKALCKLLHFVFGLISLASRQTNIFWVGVFLGGLQVVETAKGATDEAQIHDPAVEEAYIQDYLTTSVSVVQHALGILPRLILDLLPQLSLLASFAAFIVWNGGVVLGDKSNHVASIHVPQMLYFFALVIFFSWPVLLPHLSNSISDLRSRLPRLSTFLAFTLVALAIVHFNTLVHPFTLADNRHYPFYVFRYFVIPFPRKHLFAPVYVLCAWLTIIALGPVASTPTARISTAANIKSDVSRTIVFQRADTVRISFILVFLISTALSLITAPLVEPRYFMIPWLIWRLHVPEVLESDAPKQKALRSGKETELASPAKILTWLAGKAPSVELLWYAMINVATGYMFLYRPFSWEQEPGKMQRFMW